MEVEDDSRNTTSTNNYNVLIKLTLKHLKFLQ
jgi:hypothetical protein